MTDFSANGEIFSYNFTSKQSSHRLHYNCTELNSRCMMQLYFCSFSCNIFKQMNVVILLIGEVSTMSSAQNLSNFSIFMLFRQIRYEANAKRNLSTFANIIDPNLFFSYQIHRNYLQQNVSGRVNKDSMGLDNFSPQGHCHMVLRMRRLVRDVDADNFPRKSVQCAPISLGLHIFTSM